MINIIIIVSNVVTVISSETVNNFHVILTINNYYYVNTLYHYFKRNLHHMVGCYI